MEENLFPSGGWSLTEKELQEERRLCYVALTRAKKAVVLSYAETRMRNGKHESNSPSRFLKEIAPQYLQNPLRKENPFQERPSVPRPSAPRPVTPVRALGVVKPDPIPDFVPDPMDSFSKGDRIEHNRFGKGTVLDLSGEGEDLRAVVAFDKYGQKILILRHAKMRHL